MIKNLLLLLFNFIFTFCIGQINANPESSPMSNFEFPFQNTTNYCNATSSTSKLLVNMDLSLLRNNTVNINNVMINAGLDVNDLNLNTTTKGEAIFNSKGLVIKSIVDLGNMKGDVLSSTHGMYTGTVYDNTEVDNAVDKAGDSISLHNKFIINIIYNSYDQISKLEIPNFGFKKIGNKIFTEKSEIIITYNPNKRVDKIINTITGNDNNNQNQPYTSRLTNTIQYNSDNFSFTVFTKTKYNSEPEKETAKIEYFFDERYNCIKVVKYKINNSAQYIKTSTTIYEYYTQYINQVINNLNLSFIQSVNGGGNSGEVLSTNFIKKIVKTEHFTNTVNTTTYDEVQTNSNCCILKYKSHSSDTGDADLAINTPSTTTQEITNQYPSSGNNEAPVLATNYITNLTNNSAKSGGTFTLDGGVTVFERGICYGTNANPTIQSLKLNSGVGTGNYTLKMINLNTNTNYNVRAYAITCKDTVYGSNIQFATSNNNYNINNTSSGNAIISQTNSNQTTTQIVPLNETITDFNGNVYTTIKIGNQIWMKENLKVKHFRNGQPIPNIQNISQWKYLTSAAYIENTNGYTNNGFIYNGFVVKDHRKIAPLGWHIPSEQEWIILKNSLGNNPALKLKDPSWFGTNETMFHILPNGIMNSQLNSYEYLNQKSFYWSSSINSSFTNKLKCLFLTNDNNLISIDNSIQTDGMLIRCIKD